MSKNIFIKSNFIKFFIFLFVFSFSVISFSHAQTKTAGQSCTVKSSGSDCISGYRCVTSNPGQAKAGDGGVCTAIASQGGTSVPLPTFSDIGDLITNFNKNVVQNLITLLGAAALVVFLWGMVLFIVHRQQAKSDLSKDKDMMLYGLVGLFVFFSVWGIIKLFQGFLGVGGTSDMVLPRICVNGSCNAASTDGTGGVAGVGGAGSFSDPSIPLSNLCSVSSAAYTKSDVSQWTIPLSQSTTGKCVEVLQLQKFLKDNGYSLGTTGTNGDGIDGQFGSVTKNAIAKFQTDNKLVSDGVVGESTRGVILYKYLNFPPTNDSYNTKNWSDISASAGSATDITSLKQFLLDNGCYSGTVDGTFDTATEDAVKLFQKNNYLLQDGIVGPSTRAVILDPDTIGC